MVFSSLNFLCLFMPIVIVLYYVLPPFLRNGFLLIASLFFYGWGEPKYILIMIFSTVFDYGNGRLLEYFEGKALQRKLILILSVTGNLGILGFFKYFSFAISNVNQLLGTQFYGISVALPIGISFYTFQTMSYTIDVYRGEVKAQHNLIAFAMYVCLFPQLIAGPIVRYREIQSEIMHREISHSDRQEGLCRFCVGLGKKVILANQVGSLWKEILAMGDRSAGLAWLGALAFTFHIYFDFSGYSDMAIGLGRMLGFHFPENFTYPYISKSITEFWRRWHRTMGNWFREYVYIPLGGNRKGLRRQIVNLLIVWFLTGLWHGAGWNFILWGIYYFALLLIEKLFLRDFLSKAPAWVAHCYVMICVMIGWMIFACEDFGQMALYLGQMFSLRHCLDQNLLFYLGNYGFLLVIAAIGATPLPARIALRWKEKPCAYMIYAAMVLLLSVIFLVCDDYNPFLYFRF